MERDNEEQPWKALPLELKTSWRETQTVWPQGSLFLFCLVCVFDGGTPGGVQELLTCLEFKPEAPYAKFYSWPWCPSVVLGMEPRCSQVEGNALLLSYWSHFSKHNVLDRVTTLLCPFSEASCLPTQAKFGLRILTSTSDLSSLSN